MRVLSSAYSILTSLAVALGAGALLTSSAIGAEANATKPSPSSSAQAKTYLPTAEDRLLIRKAVDEQNAPRYRQEKTPAPEWALRVREHYLRPLVKKIADARKTGDVELLAEFNVFAEQYQVTDRTGPLTAKERAAIVAHLQSQQNPQSGVFEKASTDADLERKHASNGQQATARTEPYKDHVRLLDLLHYYGGEPNYPLPVLTLEDLSPKGQKGGLDLDEFLAQCGDVKRWDEHPWSIGSHAGSQCSSLFRQINHYDQTELIPVLEEGIERMLAHQSPEDGFFGKSNPLDRMSGAMKVWMRLYAYCGMPIQHHRAMADGLLKYHHNGYWWKLGPGCAARNAAILATFCLEHDPDYRRAELLDLIETAARKSAQYYPIDRDKFPDELHVLPVAIAWDWLGWEGPGLWNKLQTRQPLMSRGRQYRYQIELIEGEVQIRPKTAEALFGSLQKRASSLRP